MARVIEVDDDAQASELLYSCPQSVIDRRDRRINELSQRRGSLSKYEESLFGMYNKAKRTRRRVESLVSTKRFRNTGKVDVIEALYDIDDFRSASATMEDVIMASPTIRKRYINKRIEGYANTYRKRDEYRNAYMHSHPLYREIQNDVVIEEDGAARSYSYMMEEPTLTMSERTDARQTWARAAELLEQDMDDPTSQYSAVL